MSARTRVEGERAAPLRIRLAWAPEQAAPDAPRRNALRDRVGWLGIGTLLGLALAVSTLPDAPRGAGALSGSTDVSAGTIGLRPPEPATEPGGWPPALDRRTAAPVAWVDTRPAALSGRTGVQARPARVPARGSARPTPARAVATRTPRPAPAETAAVLDQVRRYEAAYARMDAAATQAAWPAADRQALVRHFTSLREQRLRLERCVVETPGAAATATCRGTLRYRPRLGDHTTRTQRGIWRFTLARHDDGWVIADVAEPGPSPPVSMP